MLVVNGFLEDGVFIPEKSLSDIKGRQKAVLHVAETDKDEKQQRLKAWREFSRAIRGDNEILEGEPERIRFRTPEELEII